MAPQLAPHWARYTITRGDGSAVGTEELVVDRGPSHFHIRSELTTDYPITVDATVDWELDPSLATRLLVIHSRSGLGEESELELTVTGNGLLAHRAGGDGPTQVELGWGPNAELDYLSAAFAAVMVARSSLSPGQSRRIECVTIGIEDLVPEIVTRELTALESAEGTNVLVNRAIETGHSTTLEIDPSGALRSYAGVLRLDSLTLSPAPTK
jgi:hypothetical protein